jgi:hypothetical protein
MKTNLYVRLGLWVAVALLSAGCRATQPSANMPIQIPAGGLREPVYAFLPAAHVLRVNQEDNYVLLECTVLPSPGEEAKVYRGQTAVAELVITSRQRGPFVIADKVSGDVQSGDMVKFRCVIARNSEEVVP